MQQLRNVMEGGEGLTANCAPVPPTLTGGPAFSAIDHNNLYLEPNLGHLVNLRHFRSVLGLKFSKKLSTLAYFTHYLGTLPRQKY